jgi:hypothetical protein
MSKEFLAFFVPSSAVTLEKSKVTNKGSKNAGSWHPPVGLPAQF